MVQFIFALVRKWFSLWAKPLSISIYETELGTWYLVHCKSYRILPEQKENRKQIHIESLAHSLMHDSKRYSKFSTVCCKTLYSMQKLSSHLTRWSANDHLPESAERKMYLICLAVQSKKKQQQHTQTWWKRWENNEMKSYQNRLRTHVWFNIINRIDFGVGFSLSVPSVSPLLVIFFLFLGCTFFIYTFFFSHFELIFSWCKWNNKFSLVNCTLHIKFTIFAHSVPTNAIELRTQGWNTGQCRTVDSQ